MVDHHEVINSYHHLLVLVLCKCQSNHVCVSVKYTVVDLHEQIPSYKQVFCVFNTHVKPKKLVMACAFTGSTVYDTLVPVMTWELIGYSVYHIAERTQSKRIFTRQVWYVTNLVFE